LKQGPKGSATQQKTVKPDRADKAGEGKGSLKEAAMKNTTMLGDPVSLKVIMRILAHLPIQVVGVVIEMDGHGLEVGCPNKTQRRKKLTHSLPGGDK
jgi:hypothetical protein